jgi:copper chaperone CopZ
MTKVQRHFQLQRPIDEALMEQIGVVNSIYGIERVRVEPSGNLMVEYDATRLNVAQVEGVLERAGIAVMETAGALGSI